MEPVKQILVPVVVSLIVGFVGAVMGAYVAVPLLDQRVDYVERDLRDVKDIAIKAHERINHFHAGG